MIFFFFIEHNYSDNDLFSLLNIIKQTFLCAKQTFFSNFVRQLVEFIQVLFLFSQNYREKRDSDASAHTIPSHLTYPFVVSNLLI